MFDKATYLACHCCGALVHNPAYIGNGIYCSPLCETRGPLRIQWEHAAVEAELRRRRVRFLPIQITRRIKSAFTINQ